MYKKIYIDQKNDNLEFDYVIKKIQEALRNSFLEDGDYTASSTNSKEIKKLIDGFVI